MNVLMLGAGKRLSLAEHFQRAAAREHVPLNLFAIELYEQVAIAKAAKVFRGPCFDSPDFTSYLWAVVESQGIDVVVPLMDSATVAAAGCGLRAQGAPAGVTCVVSDLDLCVTMQDKQLADGWFKENDIPVPTSRWRYPAIYKPRKGYGSRGIGIAHDEYEDFWRHKPHEYFYQPLVSGVEYTVDAYVAQDGRLLSALSRQRIEVINGEVTHSRTHRHEGILALTRRILTTAVGCGLRANSPEAEDASAVSGSQPTARSPQPSSWRGPVTLQFMDTDKGPVILEINPRFGGGAPHSISLGLDMPRFILREALGRCVEPVDDWPDGSVMVRCLRDVYL